MGLSNHKREADATFDQLLSATYKKGIVYGYDKGYDHGFEDGYEKRKGEDKPAISDGLRHGSSECGKSMRKM